MSCIFEIIGHQREIGKTMKKLERMDPGKGGGDSELENERAQRQGTSAQTSPTLSARRQLPWEFCCLSQVQK